MPPEASPPLRGRTGTIKSVKDLQRAGELLARHLGLPHDPRIKVGYVPWSGPDTPSIDLSLGGTHGSFLIARWAVRGKYRRSWETLEYALVSGIGFWLECHRRDPMFAEKGTTEALLAWYGEDVGGRFAQAEQRSARSAKGCLIVLGALLAIYLVLWAVGLAR